jgi:hypothetical protein
MRCLASIAAATMMLLAAGVSANAADRNVDIVNKTGLTMTQFYASVTNADSWEDNILGSDALENGDTQPVDINDGSGKCVFDFKAVFKGGATAEKRGINVCQISTFTFSK